MDKEKVKIIQAKNISIMKNQSFVGVYEKLSSKKFPIFELMIPTFLKGLTPSFCDYASTS